MYPITPDLKILLDKILTDERWDLKFIGMQLIIEGLALGAFKAFQMTHPDKLLHQLIEKIIQDESRHVTFGVHFKLFFAFVGSPINKSTSVGLK